VSSTRTIAPRAKQQSLLGRFARSRRKTEAVHSCRVTGVSSCSRPEQRIGMRDPEPAASARSGFAIVVFDG
jgi:hypothetical protein